MLFNCKDCVVCCDNSSFQLQNPTLGLGHKLSHGQLQVTLPPNCYGGVLNNRRSEKIFSPLHQSGLTPLQGDVVRSKHGVGEGGSWPSLKLFLSAFGKVGKKCNVSCLFPFAIKLPAAGTKPFPENSRRLLPARCWALPTRLPWLLLASPSSEWQAKGSRPTARGSLNSSPSQTQNAAEPGLCVTGALLWHCSQGLWFPGLHAAQWGLD